MLMSEAISTVRSMMAGALIDEISVLAAAYDPNVDTSITLKYPKRNIGPGSVLCVGLNTFVAVAVSTAGDSIEVLPSMDGGPNVACAANDIVYVNPQFTTYAIFREIVGEIQAMSSREVGLFSTLMFQSEGINYAQGTYFIDMDDIAADREVIRLLQSEFKVGGTDAWQRFAEAEWQPSGGVVRVTTDPPNAAEYLFTLATTFGTPTAITTDLATSCGVSDRLADIPMLGAASMMALGWEGRRVQPVAQGDTRRPGEVTVGSNASLSRQYRAKQQERINEELTRLIGLYGWRTSLGTGTNAVGWSRW